MSDIAPYERPPSTDKMQKLHPPPPIPPLIPHVRYGRRPHESDWLFFGAARQALKFLASALLQRDPSMLFVLPAYTCDSVVQALDEAGAEMAFVDIDSSLDFDLAALHQTLELASGRPLALMPTPLFGAPVRPYKSLFPQCTVIEDRAQTLPDPDSQADYQLLSFGPGKQISGMGGGALIGGHSLRSDHLALEQEGALVRHLGMSLAGDLLLGPAWSVLGQKAAQRHSAQGFDKQLQQIEPRSISEARAQWIAHSLASWDPSGRVRIADDYHACIPPSLRFDIPPGRPYLRYPVRAAIEAPGVSSGDMYERVVHRAEETLKRPLPGARALVRASLLPTHSKVTPSHIAWYASLLTQGDTAVPPAP